MSTELRARPLPIAALATLAVLVNLAAPTVFFDSQLMLGSSLAVLALLLFGWWGLVVGAAGLAVTVWRWGHAYELMIGLGFLAWLGVYLDWSRRRGGRADDGRIVLAALGYWLLFGLPAEILLFSQRMGLGLLKAWSLGLKETLTAVLSTGIGLLLFLILRLWRRRHQPGQTSARGITFAAVLLAVSLPGVLITFILTSQLKATALLAQRHELITAAALVSHHASAPTAMPLPEGVAVRWASQPGGGETSSDPDLFARLDRSYAVERPSRTRTPGLELLRPVGPQPVLRADQQAYWLVRSGGVSVVKPAEPLIRQLDHELLTPLFTLLAGLLLLATLVSELLATAVDRQFQTVIRPLQQQADPIALPDLAGSLILELQQLMELVNARTRRTRELNVSLQQARDELAQAALAITEAI
ncbi:MAG: hypothetical protein VKI83_10175, partial [Synechococcaceae cyanobacterium]|nr:hypothetical protein [Synechococcaceae cyanobacterium]